MPPGLDLMATVLIAVGERELRDACLGHLRGSGHCVLALQRPLAALAASNRVAWDVALLDGSMLGRDVLSVLDDGCSKPVVGIGLDDARLRRSLTLPLSAHELDSALAAALGEHEPALRLMPARRLASANGREVGLTRTEYKLLETLMQRRPDEVSLAEAIEAVWGPVPGSGTPAPLRAHMRNLRSKLTQIGLANALRSRRGRGYVLNV